ncbi:hypothetical protein GE09DRAFT_1217637 [Coniochaeta sp. 2T2.1]|nr:hypothetical protein GE09DRAFT_1217637 [Coniochaeta sp. 2T2.1]
MATFLDLSRPSISYYTVPAAFALLFAPHVYAVRLAGRHQDLSLRGNMVENVKRDESVPKEVRQRIIRAEAATANGLETVSLYAAGVVAANVAGVGRGSVNLLSVVYIASRLAYNYIYVIAQDDARMASRRSAAWFVGAAVIFALFTGAGWSAAV